MKWGLGVFVVLVLMLSRGDGKMIRNGGVQKTPEFLQKQADTFVHFLHEEDQGKISEKAKIVWTEWGYAVFAEEDIQRGEVVLKIRQSATIHRASVEHYFPLIKKLTKDAKGVEGWDIISMAVAHLGNSLDLDHPKDFLTSYFAMLMNRPLPPLPKPIRRPQGCGWYDVIGEYRTWDMYDAPWEIVKRVIAGSPLNIDEESYKNAATLVSSQNFGAVGQSGGNVMLPLICIMNHRHPMDQIELSTLRERGYVTAIAKKEIKKGEEIFISYGGYSNRELLKNYGFALKDNPEDTILIAPEILKPNLQTHFSRDVLEEFIGINGVIEVGMTNSKWVYTGLRIACGLRGADKFEYLDHDHTPDACEVDDSELAFLSRLVHYATTQEEQQDFIDKITVLAKKHNRVVPKMKIRPLPKDKKNENQNFKKEGLFVFDIPALSLQNEICVHQEMLLATQDSYKQHHRYCYDFVFQENNKDKRIRHDANEPKEIQRLEERKLYLNMFENLSNHITSLKKRQKTSNKKKM